MDTLIIPMCWDGGTPSPLPCQIRGHSVVWQKGAPPNHEHSAGMRLARSVAPFAVLRSEPTLALLPSTEWTLHTGKRRHDWKSKPTFARRGRLDVLVPTTGLITICTNYEDNTTIDFSSLEERGTIKVFLSRGTTTNLVLTRPFQGQAPCIPTYTN